MANYTYHYSTRVEIRTPEEKRRALRWAAWNEAGYLEPHESPRTGFVLVVDDDSLYIYSDEDGYPDDDALVALIQKWIGLSSRPQAIVIVEVSRMCSKPRPGSFGGYVYAISKDNWKSSCTYTMGCVLGDEIRKERRSE